MRKKNSKVLRYVLIAAAVIIIAAACVIVSRNGGFESLFSMIPKTTPSEPAGITELPSAKTQVPQETAPGIDKNGSYTSKDDVALYIYTYGKLPSNFITKDEAKALGWSGNGNDLLEKYAPGKSIGGDRFGNYEKLLPQKSGRTYTECDIDTAGTERGTKRIVFSNDGLVYYTEDHYESFVLLYGDP